MFGGSTPAAIASRFSNVAQAWVADGPAERAARARRKLMSAIGRGAPAVSRSVDTLVRAGLVERAPDPDNRRRLALRLTEAGRGHLETNSSSASHLQVKLERLAHSELRAIERAIEILER